MNFEIIEKRNDISYEVPSVTFPAYQEYLDKARQISDYIGGIDVSNENIKEAKKTLADARKLTDRLSGLRIGMKKEILKNYAVVESQIKEIVAVVDTADKELRAKVHELEDLERDEKKKTLQEIWDLRVGQYENVKTHFPDGFDRWMKPEYLNKTAAISATEKRMVEYLENVSTELDTAESMGDDYLVEYVLRGDLSAAIRAVKAKETIKESMSKYQEPEEETAIFEIRGTKDIKLTEMLLTENEIEYIRR